MLKPTLNTIRPFHAGFSALIPAFLGAVVLLGSPESASASTMVYARSTSTVAGTGDSLAQSAPSGSVSDSYVGDADVGATSAARTVASFGELHAYGATSMTSGGSLSSRFTTSVAAFQDDFLITSGGRFGTAGTVRVRFTINGSLSAQTTGAPTANPNVFSSNTWAQAEYGFGVGIGLNTITKSQKLFGDGQQTGTPFLGIEQEYILDFTYGVWLTDVTLRIGALSSATAQFSNYGSMTAADLEHTATWGGFGEVRDANGVLVTDYGFFSTSGTNYVAPVPEPATTSLLLASAGALGLVRARRRPAASL